MDKINVCPICGASCVLEIIETHKKMYSVRCLNCGNETDLETTKAKAIKSHNNTRILSYKDLLKGAPDA